MSPWRHSYVVQCAFIGRQSDFDSCLYYNDTKQVDPSRSSVVQVTPPNSTRTRTEVELNLLRAR